MCLNELNVIQDIPEYLKVGYKMTKETSHPKNKQIKKKPKQTSGKFSLTELASDCRMFNPLRCGELLILYQ